MFRLNCVSLNIMRGERSTVTMSLPQKPFCYRHIQSHLMTTYSCSPSGEFWTWTRQTAKTSGKKRTALPDQVLSAFWIIMVKSVLQDSAKVFLKGTLWVFWNEFLSQQNFTCRHPFSAHSVNARDNAEKQNFSWFESQRKSCRKCWDPQLKMGLRTQMRI